MLSGQPVLSPALIIVCVIMVITAGLIYWVTALGSPWTVPWAAIRATVQLAAVAGVLAAALTRLWSSSSWPFVVSASSWFDSWNPSTYGTWGLVPYGTRGSVSALATGARAIAPPIAAAANPGAM